MKSGVNHLGEDRLILTRSLAASGIFQGYRQVEVDAGEDYAANTLLANGHLVVPSGFDRTRRKLEKLGLPLVVLDVSEARKMDGGLTCLSLRF